MILEKNKDIQTHFSHVPPFSQPIKTWHLIHMRERERERMSRIAFLCGGTRLYAA